MTWWQDALTAVGAYLTLALGFAVEALRRIRRAQPPGRHRADERAWLADGYRDERWWDVARPRRWQ